MDFRTAYTERLVGDIIPLAKRNLLIEAESDHVRGLISALDTSIRLVDSGLRQDATGQVGRRCPRMDTRVRSRSSSSPS